MAVKLITIENIKYIIKQMSATFCAPFAQKLSPGAKLNGILFDGTNDITIPNSPITNIELTSAHSVSILYDGETNARTVMMGDGIYFYDGTNLYNLIKVTKNTDGTFTITSNLSQTTAAASSSDSVASSTGTSSAKSSIGFVTSDE